MRVGSHHTLTQKRKRSNNSDENAGTAEHNTEAADGMRRTHFEHDAGMGVEVEEPRCHRAVAERPYPHLCSRLELPLLCCVACVTPSIARRVYAQQKLPAGGGGGGGGGGGERRGPRQGSAVLRSNSSAEQNKGCNNA